MVHKLFILDFKLKIYLLSKRGAGARLLLLGAIGKFKFHPHSHQVNKCEYPSLKLMVLKCFFFLNCWI